MEVMTFVCPASSDWRGWLRKSCGDSGLTRPGGKMAGSCFRAVREAMAMANLWLRTGERVLFAPGRAGLLL